MNLKEFYEFHRLSRTLFAHMCHIDYADLMAYESGRQVSERTRLKIEIGMQIIEDYALRFKGNQGAYYVTLEELRDFESSQKLKLFENEFKRICTMEL